MSRHRFTAEDHERIALAIREAESRTAGEIYCVLARSSDSYFFPAAFVVTCALMATSVVVAVGLHAFWFDIGNPVFVAAQLLAWLTAIALVAGSPSSGRRRCRAGWHGDVRMTTPRGSSSPETCIGPKHEPVS